MRNQELSFRHIQNIITMAMKLNDGTPMQTHITGGEENDPNITEGQKKFIFSSTGNIMVATTEETSDNLDSNVRDVFNEVSVFFAAMTKAISTTKRPNSDNNYTLYDYAALEKVIDGSGCFTVRRKTSTTSQRLSALSSAVSLSPPSWGFPWPVARCHSRRP